MAYVHLARANYENVQNAKFVQKFIHTFARTVANRHRRIMLAKSRNYAFMDSRIMLVKSSYYALAPGDIYSLCCK